MMDTDILDLLGDIGRSSVARLSPAVTLPGDTAQARREQILQTIRGTVLPRRLEFTAANGDCLAIEVNSSRVTDVFRVRSGIIPDFETDARDGLALRLAQVVSDIAAAPAPLELVSLQPDSDLEADEVGITFSEISKACETVEIPSETVVAIVPDQPDSAEETAPPAMGLAVQFYDGAARFALGRMQCNAGDGAPQQVAEACMPGGDLDVGPDVLARFARDLAAWDNDASDQPGQPQMIVLRPLGGTGTALAVVHDGAAFSVAVHEARKLGAVVNLWTALTGPET